MSEPLVVLITAPDEERAAAIARTLVEERLLACANLVPRVRSIYRWEGKLCDEAETLIIGKTLARRWDALAARLPQLHPSQVPELLALPIRDGSAKYLEWLTASVGG
jgi:periplasmic divalent cation tolerance protein